MEKATEKNNIEAMRSKKGITQQQLGELVGVTGRAIGHYEKGIREPKLEIAKKIADVFESDIEEVFNL